MISRTVLIRSHRYTKRTEAAHSSPAGLRKSHRLMEMGAMDGNASETGPLESHANATRGFLQAWSSRGRQIPDCAGATEACGFLRAVVGRGQDSGVRETVTRLLDEAAAAPLVGWDFAWASGRIATVTPLPWDFTALAASALRSATTAVDMGTGGGEFLDEFPDLPARMVATDPGRRTCPLLRSDWQGGASPSAIVKVPPTTASVRTRGVGSSARTVRVLNGGLPTTRS